MARLRDSESVDQDDQSTVLRDSSRAPSRATPRNQHLTSHASPSPTPSNSSDKENRRQASSRTSMAPPPVPNKRQRLSDRPDGVAQLSRESSVAYDPHQDVAERQRLRKGLRDLNRDATEYKTEWLRSGNNGLLNAIKQSNTYFRKVKQTSDATIDSRFLVTAGDLAYKKTQQASVGDGSQGIDVDEFVSKCITFMRKGDEVQDARSNGTGTQARRRRRTELEHSDDEDTQEAGDAYNWAWLGMRACAPVTVRPPVPSFLLGPLSVQKKVRAPTQRRARQARADPEEAVRPRELQVEDLQQQENSSLTFMCHKINKQLKGIFHEVRRAEEEDMSDEDFTALCDRHAIFQDGGISLMHFVVNPKSFGQTVENLFYVSFLIRDGIVGVELDERGLPTLHLSNRDDESQGPSRQATRFQAVLGLDFVDWKNIVDAWGIERSLIEDRADGETAEAVGQTAWYG